MGTALILLAAAPGTDKSKVAGAVFLRQVLKTAEALRDHHRAAGNLGEAERVQRHVVDRLQRIQLIDYAPSTAEPTSVQQETGARSAGPEVGQQAREAREKADALTGTGSPVGHPPTQRQGSGPPSGPLPRPLTRPQERSVAGDRRERENDGR